MPPTQKRVRPDYAKFRDALEDFWQRRRPAPKSASARSGTISNAAM